MKKVFYIFIIILLASCDSENTNDCFQTAGGLIIEHRDIEPFESLFVDRDVEVVIRQTEDYRVTIETGINLINDISVKVVNNELRLVDNNTCNYVRDYGLTRIIVSAPNIKSIRSSTQYDISSEGILNYPELSLTSEDFNVPDTFTVGDFKLSINSQSLDVVTNNLSSIYLSGNVEDLYVGFFSGAGRFEGADLIAENVRVYHRGSNDMVVNPQQSLTGEILGTGNLISVNTPPTVDVEEIYTGRLIFRD